MGKSSLSTFRGFTLIELLVVVAIVSVGVGLFLDGGAMNNNLVHTLDSSPVALDVKSYPSTTLTSAWSFKCGASTSVPDLATSTNPRFSQGDESTVNDPLNATALTAAGRDARFVEHGNACLATFNDPEIRKLLCGSLFNRFVCYSVSSRVQTSLFGISDVTQYRFKAENSDTRCLQSTTSGAFAAVVSLPVGP